MVILLFVLVGAAVGSFLNVVIDRLPAGESLVSPGSHCPGCDRELAAWELVPIISYLALRGKCRTCGAIIPKRILVVELLTAALFGALAWQEGLSLALLLRLVPTAFLIAILFIDLEHKLVLTELLLIATGLELLFMPLWALVIGPPFTHWAVVGPMLNAVLGRPVSLGVASLLSQLLGAVVGYLIFYLVFRLARGGMGRGDVSLAGYVGLITAFPGVIAATCISYVLGGIVAAVLLVTKSVTRKTAVPFAPFLVVATWVMIFFGERILAIYLG